MTKKLKGGMDVAKGAGWFLVALFGVAIFLFVLVIIFYFIQRRAQYDATNIPMGQKMPPEDYMKHVGIKCPDYWEYLGKDPQNSSNHLCKNVQNIKLNDPKKCYTDAENKIMSFPNVDWDNTVKDGYLSGKPVHKICEWQKSCGPIKNQDAGWLGVDSSDKRGWVKCTRTHDDE